MVGEGGDIAHYRRINVGGTHCALEAARAAGARRLVHLSSVMVYGFQFPRLVDETGPMRGEGNAYCQTKIESDRLALNLHGEGGRLARSDRDYEQLVDYLLDVRSGRHYFNPTFFG